MQADHIAYDRTEDSYVAEGKVEVWEGNRKLAADRVFLNARTNEAEAIGNVILVQGEDVLRGERMKINLETSLGIIIQGSLFLKKQNFYLRGKKSREWGKIRTGFEEEVSRPVKGIGRPGVSREGKPW